MMDIAVCGNPTLDEIVEHARVSLVPGGSALYVSSAAAFLGAKVGILGNVGDDYPSKVLKWLGDRGVDLKLLKRVHCPSTRFRIVYDYRSRKLWLLQPGQEVVRRWTGPRIEGIHLGPVFNEIPKSLIKSARRHCKFLSLDIQGLVRRASSSGLVQTVRKNLRDTLELCDAVKASEDEVQIEMSSRNSLEAIDRLLAAGPSYAIVTLGVNGSLLGIRTGRKFFVPAFPEPHIVDPTGAGDVFAGSWLRTYLWTRDPVWAASVGSAFASLTSRRNGLSKFTLSRNELLRRTSWVYNRVKALRRT